MVIQLMPHGEALFQQGAAALAVHAESDRVCGGHRVALKNAAHVVEKFGSAEENVWVMMLVEAIQKELSILVALLRRERQPLLGLLPILLYITAQ